MGGVKQQPLSNNSVVVSLNFDPVISKEKSTKQQSLTKKYPISPDWIESLSKKIPNPNKKTANLTQQNIILEEKQTQSHPTEYTSPTKIDPTPANRIPNLSKILGNLRRKTNNFDPKTEFIGKKMNNLNKKQNTFCKKTANLTTHNAQPRQKNSQPHPM